MKSFLKLIILLNVTNFVLVGCNFKSVDKQVHEPAKGNTKAAENSEAVTKEVAEILKEDDWLKSIYDLVTKKDYAQVIKRASDILKDEKSFQTLSTKNIKEGTSLLGYYNYAILESIKSGSKVDGLEDYRKWAVKGCDANLKGCDVIGFLKRDSKSSAVIAAILLSKKDNLNLGEYYNLIQIGFEANNQIRTPELELAYIIKGKEYFDYLSGLGSTGAENKDRHVRLFQLILSQNSIDKNDPKMVQWFKQLNPWKYSRQDTKYSALGSVKLFDLGSKNFIYDKNAISSGLKQAITENKLESDALGDSFHSSLLTIKSDIQKGKTEQSLKILNDEEQLKVKVSLIKNQVLRNFKINLDEILADGFYDEYFYLIDRLYRGHLGLEEANVFWQGTLKNQSRLGNTIELYAKIELLKMIFKTNLYMGGIFKQKDIPNDKLFEQVVNRSQPITDEWSLFLARIETLNIFVKQKSNMGDLEKTLQGISRNIKYLSIYPNMIVIGDIMVDLQADLTVASFWGNPIKIDPKRVMKIIIDGKIEDPWFIFGGDASPLNRTETIYAYYFSLETGVFDTFALFKDSGSGKIAQLNFFKNAVRRTLSEETNTLKSAIEKMNDLNSNVDVSFQNTMIACESIAKGNLNFSLTAPAEDIKKHLLFGNSTGGALQSLYRLYNSGPIGQYTNFRDDFESLVIQIKSMMEILALKLDSAEDQKALQELTKEMASYEELRRHFYEAAIEQHNKVSSCLNQLVKLEVDRTLTIYELEAQFFGKVYDQSLHLRQILDPNQKKLSFEKMKTSLNLGTNDFISESSYQFSNWSLIKRVIGYNKNLKPQVNYDLPDQSNQDQMDLVMFNVPFLDSSTSKLFTKEEFISFSMRTVLSQAQDRFHWINTMVELTPLFNKMESVMSLFNLRYDLSLRDTKSNTVTAKPVTVKDVLDEAQTILSFIGISSREEKILNYLRLRSRETKDNLVGILFDSPDSEFKGIMDKSFSKWIQNENDLNEATSFYNDSFNSERFLFPVPIEVTEIVQSKYKNKIHIMDARVRDIFTGLEQLEKNTKADDFSIRYELGSGGRGIYSPSLIKAGNFRLVSLATLDDAKKKLNNFHKVKTGECFLKTANPNCFSKKANVK